MKMNGSTRPVALRWLARILLMHLNAASMRTVSGAASRRGSRRMRHYLAGLPTLILVLLGA